jgi:hypothetical protein
MKFKLQQAWQSVVRGCLGPFTMERQIAQTYAKRSGRQARAAYRVIAMQREFFSLSEGAAL